MLDLQHISRWAKTAQRLPRNRQNGVGRAYIPHNLAISEDHPAPAWGILPGQDNSNCPLCSGVTVFCNRFLAKCNSFVLQNILHNSVPHLEQKTVTFVSQSGYKRLVTAMCAHNLFKKDRPRGEIPPERQIDTVSHKLETILCNLHTRYNKYPHLEVPLKPLVVTVTCPWLSG